MKRYNVINDDNEVIKIITANSQEQAAEKFKFKYPLTSHFVKIEEKKEMPKKYEERRTL